MTDEKIKPESIPTHHSMVNHLMNEVHGRKYQPLKSLEEAKTFEDGTVILEGDWGGMIFLTCPVKYLSATQQEIEILCLNLEKHFWACNFKRTDGGWGVYYEQKTPNSGVWGGMGGGLVIDGLWTHKRFDSELISKVKEQLKYKGPCEDSHR